jgi:oligopeptide/dipeptide ABC transporter ATP-binding protein
MTNGSTAREADPYTLALQQAVPIRDPETEATRQVVTLTGEVPDPANPPTGCPFHPRCSLAEDLCRRVPPLLAMLAQDHAVACHVAARRLGRPEATMPASLKETA